MSPNRWEMPPVYLQSGDPEAENTATLHAPGLLGARFTVIQPTRGTPGAEDYRSKRYQLIRTDSTMAVAPYRGAVAWWADKAQYLVTTAVTATTRNRIAGVFQNAITGGNYGCIQIGGPARTKFTDASSPAVGDLAIPSATAGKAEDINAGSSPTYQTLGEIIAVLDIAAREYLVDLDVPEST